MAELLTAAQMRAIEQAAIESGQVTGLELMERAGRGVVEAIFEEWPELAKTAHRAVVLCGPGNNGGDGFVVARLLKEWGWEVEVYLYGDPEKLPPDARVNYERWGEMGETSSWPTADAMPDPWAADIIIDALFGTGLTRPIPFDERNVSGMLPEWDLREDPECPRIVSVDVPSGLCADSGRTLEGGDSLWSDLTVTFHRMKLGHVLAEGEFQCRGVRVVDIGLKPDDPLQDLSFKVSHSRVQKVDAVHPFQLGKTDFFGRPLHKYSHGSALLIGGATGRGGAARLAARGALRIGAGLVTVGCPSSLITENAAQLNAIMLAAIDDVVVLDKLLAAGRLDAVCIGPGLGTGHTQAELLEVVLGGQAERAKYEGQAGLPSADDISAPHGAFSLATAPLGRRNRSLVLDADALTLLSKDPDLFAALHENCVLTPHAGEFRRLFPDIADKLDAPATKGPAYSKVDATREAAARAGCTVLFKGPDTVIADPTGRCAINASVYDRAAPWLATAGSGDVLAGFITGLLARGFTPFNSACTGAWLHTECALSFGPGLIAEDIPEELPKVFRALGV